MSDPEQKLVKLLHSAAAYNDKGFIWMNHSQEVTEKLRVQWRGEIDELIRQIGPRRFSSELLEMLSNQVVVALDLRRPSAARSQLFRGVKASYGFWIEE